MKKVELEKTYLLKKLPKRIKDCDFCEIIDIYIPTAKEHPILRIRKKANNFEITKKEPIEKKDSSEQSENTVVLSKEEFNELFSNIKGKRLRKKRYYYKTKGRIAEIDIFLDKLKGLALVDFEFDSKKEKNNFIAPDFCLADVTQDKFAARGMLAGRNYSDIQKFLDKYNYQKII
ncbi:MAG: hypothetical protein ACOCRX_06100, partial [Candidatus Woesearchaeota archaeon]